MKQVCFGAKDNNFGTLRHVGKGGLVAALLLIHRSGRVRCSSDPRSESRWGCHGLWGNVLNVIVTGNGPTSVNTKGRGLGQMWVI